jgi:hypothetical protein
VEIVLDAVGGGRSQTASGRTAAAPVRGDGERRG